MAFASDVYTGNGSTTTFALTFPYVRPEHVVVFVNFVSVAYTYTNSTTVNVSPAPGNGLRVEVRRVTPLANPLVDFTDGAVLVAADLDTNALQNLYIEQELDDKLSQAITIDPTTGLPTANSRRITNVANPVNAQDAATKIYVDTADALKVSKAGDSMSGALAMGTNKITGLGTPTVSTDAVTKAYIDAYINTAYLGPLASDPATRPSGGSLQIGDQYFNTTQNIVKAWTGTVWVISAAAGNIIRWRKTASAGNTTLSGTDDLSVTLSYVVGNEQVYLNGALQTRGIDYTAATGTSITLTPALLAGDVVELHAVQGYVSATITPGSINDALVAAAAGIQASKLSFTQAGTGAVARTVDSKLKDFVSVKDFGAVGDGVANDTTAIQAAIDSAAVNNRLLLFPLGTYLVTNTLTIYSGSTLRGEAGWAYPAAYGPTLSSNILFQPTSLKNLFDVGNNPNIGGVPAFYTKISISNLILLGNGATYSQYGLNLDKVIYSNFDNLTITNFKWPVRLNNTINNRFDSIYLTGTTACVRYSGSATTDTWRQCSFFGSPVGVQTVGATIGIRFIDCLFEQIDTYGADIIKETENMSFINCYSEDVPYTNTATGCMYRVGLDGATLVVENHLIVIGGTYHGRNAGTIGDWMSVDYSNGVIVSGVGVSRYTNVFKGTANTRSNSIVCLGLNGISFTSVYSGTTGKLTGIFPSSVINSGSNDQIAAFASLTLSGRATVGQVNFGNEDLSRYDEYTAPAANCTGAYIASAIWKATIVGNKVTLTLPDVSAALNAGGQAFFAFGELLLSTMRPIANTGFPCTVTDGATRAVGLILVLTTGAIRVYRSIDTITTFAGTGGLAYPIGVSWTV